MASPNISSSRKDKKEESFLDKIGTIARKKKIKEAVDLEIEGKHAIESPTSPTIEELGPEFYFLQEGEERSMIEKHSREDPKVVKLQEIIIDWINDELAEYRIIVKQLEEDLFDGQIFQKLIEKLTNTRIEVPEVSQSELGQKQKLKVIIERINRILDLHKPLIHLKWNVDNIHGKSLVAILHLLVAIVLKFHPPIRLPENVELSVIVVGMYDGRIQTRSVTEEMTGHYSDVGSRYERDGIDTMFDLAPDKLEAVKKSLIGFANRHLNKINLDVLDLKTQFHDGVNFILLMGLLEGYFVPTYHFYLTPADFDEKVHNVTFAFQLMLDAGLDKPKSRPEDIVNADLKCTLKVLYNLLKSYTSKK